MQVAITLRAGLAKLAPLVGLPSLAPFPSYLAAIEAGVKLKIVFRNVLRETFFATVLLAGAAVSLFLYLWTIYRRNQYAFM